LVAAVLPTTDHRLLTIDKAVLRTLDNYIMDEPSQDWLMEPVWRQIGRDRRVTQIFAVSAICHILFYVTIIWLSWHGMRNQITQPQRQPELVKIAELAPPADKIPALRSQSEAIERADTTNFQYDPNNANDVNITNRSPKSTIARGVETKLPSASQFENQSKAVRGAGDSDKSSKANPAPHPPETTQVSAVRAPQPDKPVTAQGIPTQTIPAPPAPPAPKPAASGNTNNPQQTVQTGRPQGNSEESAVFALQAAKAQYLAYVRTKIRKVNERIMPKDFIESVLSNTASADFEVVLGRSGQILSTQMIRSSGYKQLDARAREAIQLAKPFEGYPPNAGDIITLTVTIYYTPGR
jgi:TonB family protein